MGERGSDPAPLGGASAAPDSPWGAPAPHDAGADGPDLSAPAAWPEQQPGRTQAPEEAPPPDGTAAPEASHVEPPPGPAIEPPAGDPDALTSLRLSVDRLVTEVERLHERSSADKDVIQRMQARIEELQRDQVRALLGPVVSELANLHGTCADAATRDYVRLGPERVRKEFMLLGEHVETALDLLGAVSVDAQPGESFDSRLHTAVRQVPTDDQDLDARIESVVRQGFFLGSTTKPALYARVTVHRYDPSLAAPEAAIPDVPAFAAPTADAGPVESPRIEDAPVAFAPEMSAPPFPYDRNPE